MEQGEEVLNGEEDEGPDEWEDEDIPGGVEILEEGVGGEEEQEELQEGGLLGEDDDSGESASLTDSEEAEGVDGEEDDMGEEEEKKIRRRKGKRAKKHKHEEEERGAREEEEGEEEEDDDQAGLESIKSEDKGIKLTAVISGFDLDMGDDVGEEESSESSESEPTPLTREPLYTQYLQNMQHYAARRRMNNFLHKKMAEYFKKRKMEHVIREMAEHLEEAKMKYRMKLDNFEELIEYDRSQRAAVNSELKVMKQVREVQVEKARVAFEEFVAKERETGIGLINSKTGKEIADKVVEKLLNNQKNKAREIQNLRLMHFKIRNAVVDKHASIRALDRIGENYTLMEFEQLKIENQAHMDKLEEREDELTKLRKKCSGAIQCLAHVREKCSAVEVNIRMMKDKLEKKDLQRAETRERMNELKQKRDYFRRETQRLRQENGLLTKDKLLVDMEESIAENKRLAEMIKRRTKVYNGRKEKLAILKDNYERERRRVKAHGAERDKSKSLNTSKSRSIHRMRKPTIMMPVFPEIEY